MRIMKVQILSFGIFPFLKAENMLYSILNSLNYNVANFYAYTKFKGYISEKTLDKQLLQRSMSIHRDFSALFLQTKRRTGICLSGTFRENRETFIQRGNRY